jgi:hypothetical protein
VLDALLLQVRTAFLYRLGVYKLARVLKTVVSFDFN